MSDANAVTTAKPVDLVRHALERMKPQFAMALPKHLSPERLIRIAMTSVQRNPRLLDCDRQSFFGAVMTAAQLGLEPDGILGQAYLVPFAGKVQFIPGYRGLITLARNSGEITYIGAHEIREADQFDFDFASGDPPSHKFNLRADRGEMIGVYAIAKFRDGAVSWDMMTVAEVDRIRDGSSGYQAAARRAKGGKIDSPWVDHYVEMAKKTAIRRIAKYLPLSVQKAAEIDAVVAAGVHVQLDKFGDVQIEDRSIEGEAEAVPVHSKLEAFEAAHEAKREAPAQVTGEYGDEDAFGLRPIEAAEPVDVGPQSIVPDERPRSALWGDPLFTVYPEKTPSGGSDWYKWADSLEYLVAEATSAERAKLLVDNDNQLKALYRENRKLHESVMSLLRDGVSLSG